MFHKQMASASFIVTPSSKNAVRRITIFDCTSYHSSNIRTGSMQHGRFF
jgi:hypothetical protein